jgi:hypothetical protein
VHRALTERLLFRGLTGGAARRPGSAMTDSARGEQMLHARALRRGVLNNLEEKTYRVEYMKEEEERLTKLIAETKARTQQQLEARKRAEAIKKVEEQATSWKQEEQELRRQAVSETRQQMKKAIEARRLAALQARHDSFLSQKREAELGRAAIMAARAQKQTQARARTAEMRQRSSDARSRGAIQSKERLSVHKAQEGIASATEQAETRIQQQLLAQLQAEEQRLLQSVLSTHAEHRAEFDRVQQQVASLGRGTRKLTTNPAPLAVPPPLPADSPLLSRRPTTALRSQHSPRDLRARPWTSGNSVSGSPRRLGPLSSTPRLLKELATTPAQPGTRPNFDEDAAIRATPQSLASGEVA